MNRALLYLSATLLKRRCLLFCRGLKHPLQLLTFVLAASVFVVLFFFRNDPFVGNFVSKTPLVFFLSLLLIVSLSRALFQRGLVFDAPDIEFLLAGPFKEEQLIFYRLIPTYFGSIFTLLIFSVLFWNHFEHPVITGAGVALFQIVCAHVSMAVSIYSGGLTDKRFSRLKVIAGILIFAYCVLWIQKALNDSAPLERVGNWEANGGRACMNLLFYPTGNPHTFVLSEPLNPTIFRAVEDLIRAPASEISLAISILFLIPLCWVSLRLLVGMQTGIFEPVLMANDRRTLVRNKNQYALPGLFHSSRASVSATLPAWRIFEGARGALIWKNLICASRSKGRLLYALACTVVVTASALTIVLALRNMTEGEDFFELNLVVPSMIGFLAFLLQTGLPFDLRLDAFHLDTLRTLPVRESGLAAGFIAVPCMLSIAFQGSSLVMVSLFAPFPKAILTAMVFGFPAAIGTIQLAWNIYYTLTQGGGSTQAKLRKSSAASIFVVLSALVALFYPAGYVVEKGAKLDLLTMALLLAVVIQYGLVVMLLVTFARLIGRRGRMDHPATV